MSEFQKYIHLERYGTDAVDGITLGKCHIFPKLDGTNASVWMEGSTMCFGSRNRQLALDNDNAGFANWAIKHRPLQQLLAAFPEGTRIFGEWLVPHSLKTYREDAWKRFYVFDVQSPDGSFLHYDVYYPTCVDAGVDYIPCMMTAQNPTYDVLVTATEKNTFLLKENQGFGEGVVIKQYGWVNRFGNTTWAKLITNTFKDAHVLEMGGTVVNTRLLEEDIVDEFVTPHVVDKVMAKIRVDQGSFSAKNIPQLLGMVYHDLVSEELWEAVKKHKNPRIDFKVLNHCTITRVKALKAELFGMK
jgi:hypothetical protein